MLRTAMNRFWLRGYKNTSISDISRETGLQPGSLYAAFKDKRTLFLECLDLYASDIRTFIDEAFKPEIPPMERIHLFMSFIVNDVTINPEEKGCLLVSTLIETRTEDAEINRTASEGLLQLEEALCNALSEGMAQAALGTDRDPRAIAKLIMTTAFGLRVYSRISREKTEIQAISDQLLSVLDCKRESR